MQSKIFPFVVFLAVLLASSIRSDAANITWHDVRSLELEGKGWTDTKDYYDRLPARAESMVRPAVWNLSLDSAGMAVRFITDATTISAKWTLREESLSMPHMPASGVSGLDLYVKEQGTWRWIGAGRPKAVTTQADLVKNLPAGEREYLLYLPLYNGVKSVEIGIPSDATFRSAPSRRHLKPIVFYGTSILHGGCASRPGMAYPSIIGRKLNWPIINLGFSGNAKSEPELAQLLAELDPLVYLLDPLPNMDAASVRERIPSFVRTLRAAHPTTPIVLVESISYTDGFLIESRRNRYTGSNTALREVFNQLKKEKVGNLHYIPGNNLIGLDGEGTVDGTHPNDLGFLRMAEAITPTLQKLVYPGLSVRQFPGRTAIPQGR